MIQLAGLGEKSDHDKAGLYLFNLCPRTNTRCEQTSPYKQAEEVYDKYNCTRRTPMLMMLLTPIFDYSLCETGYSEIDNVSKNFVSTSKSYLLESEDTHNTDMITKRKIL